MRILNRNHGCARRGRDGVVRVASDPGQIQSGADRIRSDPIRSDQGSPPPGGHGADITRATAARDIGVMPV